MTGGGGPAEPVRQGRSTSGASPSPARCTAPRTEGRRKEYSLVALVLFCMFLFIQSGIKKKKSKCLFILKA